MSTDNRSSDLGYWDTTKRFVDGMNAIADQNRTHKVRLEAPFSALSKYEEILIAEELGGVHYAFTLTCYDPDADGRSCGKCPSCSERIANFAKAGIKDPIEYKIDIPWDKLLAR